MRTAVIPVERYALYDKLIFAVFVLALPPVLASNWSVFRDGDVSWHVAAGRWILEHGRVPDSDPFSFTKAGQPWVAHEWLAEIVYALAFNLAAHAGLAAVVALALTALFAIVFIHLRARAGPVALLAAFAALYVVLQPFVLARPHVLAWPILAGWTAVLLDRREKGRPPPLPLALLMLVWANVHASFIIGLVIAAAIALDAMIGSRWSRDQLRRWLVFGLISLAAALINANGLDGFLHPLAISGMESLSSIGEWAPSSPRPTPLFYVILLLALAALLVKRPRFTAGELLLLLFTLGLAFMHIRHQSIFIILAVLIVTPKLARAGRSQAPPLFGSRGEQRAWTAAAVTAALVIAAARSAIPLQPRESFSNPRGLIAHVPQALRDQPVFNEYSIGGPLILAGIRPYIDGRADMYGDAFVSDYLKMTDGDIERFERAVDKYGIRWTMLQKNNRLLKYLDASPEWRRLYSDEVGAIHVRRTPGTQPAGTNRSGNSR